VPAGGRAGGGGGAGALEVAGRRGGRVFELVEDGALGVVRLDRLRNPLDRPIRQSCGLPAAEVGFDAAAGNASAGRAAAVTPAGVSAATVTPAAVTARRF